MVQVPLSAGSARAASWAASSSSRPETPRIRPFRSAITAHSETLENASENWRSRRSPSIRYSRMDDGVPLTLTFRGTTSKMPESLRQEPSSERPELDSSIVRHWSKLCSGSMRKYAS